MGTEKIFSRSFLENELASLAWVETERHDAEEFFGGKLDDTIGIPEDIGDAFTYRLQCPEIQVDFCQQYLNSLPLKTYQHLAFAFRRQRNPGREHASPAKIINELELPIDGNITFYRGQNGTAKTNIRVTSETLRIHHHVGKFSDNLFTEYGNAVMVDLLSQKRNILRVAGIVDNEHQELETFLDLIEQKYESGSLVPEDAHRI